MWYVIHNDELYHHGILGQKWGKRNGPPYPLGAGDHSANEKKAGWRKSLDNGTNDSYNKKSVKNIDSGKNQKHGLTDSQKRIIKIGITSAAAVLAVYGGYKLYNNGKINPGIAGIGYKGRLFTLTHSKTWMQDDSAFDGLTDQEKKSLTMLRNSAIKINGAARFGALGDPQTGTIAFGKLPVERRTNCAACTIAGIKQYLLGGDITAREDYNKIDPYRIAVGDNTIGPGMSKRLLNNLIPGIKSTEAHCDGLKDLKSYISKTSNGTTGAMFLPIGFLQDPHWVQWVNVGGKAFVVDNQAGIVSGIDKYMKDMRRFTVTNNNGKYGLDDDCCLSIYTISKDAISNAKDIQYFVESKGGKL